ncbi:exopolyphosphatase / guanosine-5'-triphosphate,3'-diphosphate pyrophosphatase [Actinobaculum suis]|uniref:Exopolyphosphatase n=1 Tax=Actinobaculum suis TaxID=1657 RepID=A0A1G7BB14_9ACTO|nr:exopolyphosphatase [Actinobaculum suis]MDY5153593.1 exopolyphosphatase [Actinobaculum suis]SDE24304.1 exopolyphosphatase / guanosine-5'-triphosphate,3'-diphosphate pyrophosphatase [Actinobaculum suis]
MRVAGIDCGTNSIRLLIAEVPGAGGEALHDVVRTMEIVYLGQGVDKNGVFAKPALERTLAAVADYARQCEKHEVESIRFAATSATRDAANRDIFLDGVENLLGVRPQVLTGEQEAETSFSGALSALETTGSSPILAIDLGGGSTELVLGTRAGKVLAEYSMNVGSVRMRERHLHEDPPTPAQVAAARADVERALDEAEKHVDLGAAAEVIGLAGTVTSVAAKWLDLETYDSEKIHGLRMPISAVRDVCEWYIYSPRAEREALGFMAPGRVPMIPSGALVWQTVVNRIAQRVAAQGRELAAVRISEHDILDGLALWAAREPQAPRC